MNMPAKRLDTIRKHQQQLVDLVENQLDRLDKMMDVQNCHPSHAQRERALALRECLVEMRDTAKRADNHVKQMQELNYNNKPINQ